MSFSLAPLLVHSDAVPVLARQALRAAVVAPPDARDELLAEAARVLYDETDLECSDVRELVGLE
ncbi:MAG TPA: hypothetical protein VGH28_30110 [Polyangiaceae bacterium]